MNKKQAIIIVTLLVLIVSLGMVSIKTNNLISKNGKKGEQTAISFNSKEQQESKANYFLEARMSKQEETGKVLQNLKQIIDDENIDKDQKKKILEEFNNIATNAEKENKVEIALKGKGFEDVVCMIENNTKVRVIVKSEKLTDKQTKQIQDVVMSITGLNNVEIENKQ